MALNIKNQDVESLLNELVQLTGESKTEAVRKALAERRQSLTLHFGMSQPKTRLLTFLQEEIWPQIPADQRGRRLSKPEVEAILGYGVDGV
jgi:antitoxin VapB